MCFCVYVYGCLRVCQCLCALEAFNRLIYLTNITRRSAAFKVWPVKQFRKVTCFSGTVLARSVMGFVRSFASYVCAVTRGGGGKGCRVPPG